MLKKYNLTCPTCNEKSVAILAGDPSTVICTDCGDPVDIDGVHDFVNGWIEYLKDREQYLNSKEG